MTKLKTIHTVSDFKSDVYDTAYSYQENLTQRLDAQTGDFDQNIINQIILWKVDRYVEMSQEALTLLNSLCPKTLEIDRQKTVDILRLLLNTKGVRLAMASTILRFRNPDIYQIIDQRAYRFLYGKDLGNSSNLENQIETYLLYLEDLRKVCKDYKIEFRKADRILYQADIKHNLDFNIKR